jgi:hypothetical protein
VDHEERDDQREGHHSDADGAPSEVKTTVRRSRRHDSTSGQLKKMSQIVQANRSAIHG